MEVELEISSPEHPGKRVFITIQGCPKDVEGFEKLIGDVCVIEERHERPQLKRDADYIRKVL